jgi:hypothetical protein
MPVKHCASSVHAAPLARPKQNLSSKISKHEPLQQSPSVEHGWPEAPQQNRADVSGITCTQPTFSPQHWRTSSQGTCAPRQAWHWPPWQNASFGPHELQSGSSACRQIPAPGSQRSAVQGLPSSQLIGAWVRHCPAPSHDARGVSVNPLQEACAQIVPAESG